MSTEEEEFHAMINYLCELLETVAQQAGYTRMVNPSSLTDHIFYFDVCSIIFPSLRMKLISIKQYQNISPPEMMQQLIDLLQDEVRHDLSPIKGKEIMKFNLDSIYQFLNLLFIYSKEYMDHNQKKMKKNEAISEAQQKVNKAPGISSARDKRQYEEDDDIHGQIYKPKKNKKKVKVNKEPHEEQQFPRSQSSEEIPKQQTKKMIRESRKQFKEEENIPENIINVLVKQKERYSKAAERDRRKNNITSLNEAKNTYKSYLKNYKKQNVVKKNREDYLADKANARKSQNRAPLKDVGELQNFFESFTLKFRDQKELYLRKMQKIIKKQEMDRFCYKNRLEREARQQAQSSMNELIKAQMHQHKVRKGLIKEKGKVIEESIVKMKKQYKHRVGQQEKQYKQEKRKELRKIENYLKQENDKIFMALEDGGRLEKSIMQMYKRF